MNRLNGKLALITGGASGIGLATAKLFAQNGASVILVDIAKNVHQVAEEMHQLYPQVNTYSYICDVTNLEKVETLFQDFKKNGFIPNIIVNSAGIARKSSFLTMKEEEWDLVINVNLKGTFLVTQQAVKLLVENFPNVKFENATQTYASIINLSSQAATLGSPLMCHYSTTKAGLIGFTKSIAKELGAYRIRVNAVLPYFIDTPLITPFMQEEAKTRYSAMTSLKRLGLPEEVAETILFLGSDSSSYVNASNIEIHGGL